VKTYRVNDLFYTVQGEGFWTGRAAVFCRFSGCNLWSGVEADRASAICTFCDTDFVAGTTYDTGELATAIDALWPGGNHKMVVFTGGEPALQLDNDAQILLTRLRNAGFYIAVETNGTRQFVWRELIDWVCVSPKTRRLQTSTGDEMKLVYPQARLTPEMFSHHAFSHFWLSPMDGPAVKENTAAALAYVAEHQQWRLNIQTHKVVGVK
jgi:7-carboxy-7-deazaguanine synthase